MNNYYELLAIESTLNIQITTKRNNELVVTEFSAPLLDPVNIKIDSSQLIISVKIEEFELWPHFMWADNFGYYFTTDKPFYHWLHQVTGQGWLLYPE